jgi:arylsulfatase A-like enzyme
MKAIMVMFDSLNRQMLPPYGCEWTHAPNFARLAERSVTFDNCYVGSMPCMPARRELHTGRYNFLHRSWGPVEPFDDSAPELLKQNGVYTHLVSDHQHYWEDGGGTYHTRYNSWEISRGQEGDPWKGEVKDPKLPENLADQKKLITRADTINRKYLQDERQQPQAQTFAKGLEFINTNHDADNWFLQIETFDPHEPFFSHKKYKELYPHEYNGPEFDWPNYGKVTEPREMVEHCRYEYAALLSMCDHYLGKVLDLMDQYHLWEDTLLIVNTDHGFLLGEHDYWGKSKMPYYNEIAKIPLFIWDPRCGRRGERCDCLVQNIDMPATLLEYFGIDLPEAMQGVALKETIAANQPVREAVLYGCFGAHVNCCDGRYVYMRGIADPSNEPLYQYTLMPAHMRRMFTVEELQTAELVDPLPFTKGCKVLKVKSGIWDKRDSYSMSGYSTPDYLGQNFLFDLTTDPEQLHPLQQPEIEKAMIAKMVRLMKENDAPPEQFKRLGLPLE